MRIGLFTDTYAPSVNGVATSVLMLKNEFEKMGHNVYLVTTNTKDKRYVLEDNNHTLRIPGISTGIYDYKLTSVYPKKAIDTIKKWHLDVIHVHTEFGVGTFARAISKKLNIPLVYTYHTIYEDYTHYITKGHIPNLSRSIARWLSKRYCNDRVTELIVPTIKIHNLLAEKYKIDREINIIPTGLEMERFHKENQIKSTLKEKQDELGLTKKDFILLYVGRIAEEKSIDFLIKVHRELFNIDKNVKLIIVGSGPEEVALKELAKKLKIERNVIFTGKVPFDDIPVYYNISHCLVTASTSETQGLTIQEALGAGLPSIVINDDAFKIAVTHGKNGFIFNDRKEYINIISNLIKNQYMLHKLAKEARKTSESFTSKKYALTVLKVYNKAISKTER